MKDPRRKAAAFEALYSEAAPSLYVLATGLVGRSDAADLLQEACTVAFKRMDKYQQGSDFRAWMAAILRHTASNHLRGERRRTRRTLKLRWSLPRHTRTPEPGAPEDHPDDNAKLLTTIDRLESDQRACLLLRVVQGLSYAEIGSVLDIPEATARSHVFRARQSLLKSLDTAMEACDA